MFIQARHLNTKRTNASKGIAKTNNCTLNVG